MKCHILPKSPGGRRILREAAGQAGVRSARRSGSEPGAGNEFENFSHGLDNNGLSVRTFTTIGPSPRDGVTMTQPEAIAAQPVVVAASPPQPSLGAADGVLVRVRA